METYKKIISSVSIVLKEFGFNRKKENFILKKNNNIGIVNFQKSRDSTASTILFTINIGVYIHSLSMFNNMDMDNDPVIDGCQWKERINPLNESWWKIDEKIDIEKVTNEVINVLKTVAIPNIEKNIVDENLEKRWQSGLSGGLSEQQRQLYLIALLKANNRDGWKHLLEHLLNYSKGKSFELNIKENIEKLG